MEDDTIKLLRECNAGIKMGVKSIDDVLDHVTDAGLKDILVKCKKNHENLGNATHRYLRDFQDDGKEPAAMAKMMSWMKTNMKLTGEDSDRVVADLMTDGANMGVKLIYKYLHQYSGACDEIKKLAEDIIDEEEKLVKDLRKYL